MTDRDSLWALRALRAGNDRFAAGLAEKPRQDAARRLESAMDQRPFAAVIACSDSRVSPEILFDQGIGDLFVVRSAGNLVDDVGEASIEYAVGRLRVPLVLVLAHSGCGAVAAAIAASADAATREHAAEEKISVLIDMIRPAVERARIYGANAARRADRAPGAELSEAAARENAWAVAERLSSSRSVIARAVGAGSLAIVTAYYDLSSGLVSFDGDR